MINQRHTYETTEVNRLFQSSRDGSGFHSTQVTEYRNQPTLKQPTLQNHGAEIAEVEHASFEFSQRGEIYSSTDSKESTPHGQRVHPMGRVLSFPVIVRVACEGSFAERNGFGLRQV